MLIVDLLNCLPPTSVQCETTFSQMKLIKTSRRTKLRQASLNNILLVKLLSPTVQNFNPQASIDKWLVSKIITVDQMQYAAKSILNLKKNMN